MNEERPIEKLLRRYAKKRRDESGPPPELHPATRRLLQGEVARQFPQTRSVERVGLWAILRARWVYAAACVVVLGVGTVMLLPSLRDQQSPAALAGQNAEITLAKASRVNEDKLPAERVDAPAPAPIAATAVALDDATTLAATPRAEPTTQLSFKDEAARRLELTPTATRESDALAADQFKSTRDTPGIAAARPETGRFAIAQPEQTVTRTTSPPGEAKPALAVGVSSVADADKGIAVPKSRAASPPARTTLSSADGEARSRNALLARGGGLERDDRATVSQAFANLAPAPADEQKQKAAPIASVLANFRIEQSGDQMRVIDEDGSTYFGVTPALAVVATAATDAKNAAAAFSQSARSQPPSYSRQAGETNRYLYRVEGTNRTLNQAVSFAWNFVAPTNAPGAAANTAGGNLQSVLPLPWTEAAINGRAQINTGEQFEVNAAPIKP